MGPSNGRPRTSPSIPARAPDPLSLVSGPSECCSVCRYLLGLVLRGGYLSGNPSHGAPLEGKSRVGERSRRRMGPGEKGRRASVPVDWVDLMRPVSTGCGCGMTDGLPGLRLSKRKQGLQGRSSEKERRARIPAKCNPNGQLRKNKFGVSEKHVHSAFSPDAIRIRANGPGRTCASVGDSDMGLGRQQVFLSAHSKPTVKRLVAYAPPGVSPQRLSPPSLSLSTESAHRLASRSVACMSMTASIV